MGTNKDWDRRITKGAGTDRKGQEQGKSDTVKDGDKNTDRGTETGI